MNTDHQVIGAVSTIDLPELGFNSIPARIDTGARTSAIWASEVNENDGILDFKLFDKQSDFYLNKIIKVNNYDRRLVTNSTGHKEERYTVKLLIELEGRIIRGTFTLANRSAQTYPVLIGRNILRGKFIVNVKHRETRARKVSK